ncbi:MAG: nucleotidyltransferase domain-containing protein [Bacillota bacterium]
MCDSNSGGLVNVDKNVITQQVASVLKDFPQVAGAYLFGSALGALRRDSDIDIGLILEDIAMADKDKAQLEAGIANSLSPLNGHVYDVVLLDPGNTIFCFRVIKEGQLIYTKNIGRVTDVIEYVSRCYAEVYPRYRDALEEIISEVISGGKRP